MEGNNEDFIYYKKNRRVRPNLFENLNFFLFLVQNYQLLFSFFSQRVFSKFFAKSILKIKEFYNNTRILIGIIIKKYTMQNKNVKSFLFF